MEYLSHESQMVGASIFSYADIRPNAKAHYVLTSKRTFSAAEEFTYNLKSLKRAKIVGETTGGGAHPGGGRRINEHFAIWVPTGRAINPNQNKLGRNRRNAGR